MEKNRLVFIGLGLILVSAFFYVSTSGGQDPIIPKGNKIQCNFKLSNPLFNDPEVSELDCNIIDECIGIGLPQSFIPFAITDPIFDQGKVVMSSGGKTDKADYQLIEGFSDRFSLEVCSPKTDGTIKVYNENNAVVNSYIFEAQ